MKYWSDIFNYNRYELKVVKYIGERAKRVDRRYVICTDTLYKKVDTYYCNL